MSFTDDVEAILAPLAAARKQHHGVLKGTAMCLVPAHALDDIRTLHDGLVAARLLARPAAQREEAIRVVNWTTDASWSEPQFSAGSGYIGESTGPLPYTVKLDVRCGGPKAVAALIASLVALGATDASMIPPH